MNDLALVPAAPVYQAVPVVPAGYARLNITFGGANGDLIDPVAYDLPDADIRRMATEAVQNGSIPGIAQAGNANFADFVVERFPATDELPNRVMLRPKTPFGA